MDHHGVLLWRELLRSDAAGFDTRRLYLHYHQGIVDGVGVLAW
jgi:hypothetical protein